VLCDCGKGAHGFEHEAGLDLTGSAAAAIVCLHSAADHTNIELDNKEELQ